MKIEIQRITLENFKGIKSLEVGFGQDTQIFGVNASGKTTVFDGFLWCLFGKDSQNKADFEIKPLEATGAEKHNLETMVETALTADGKPATLRKVYREKYTKKRGTATQEFSGHTTEYFLDDVPLQKKEFDERVKGIINEDVFRLLTDPRYFNEQLHWTDRRNILMEICGDVETADVLDSMATLQNKGEIGRLTDLLNQGNIDDLKKKIAAQKKEINEQLQKIPVRIDEQARSMAEIRPDIDSAPGMIEVLEAKKVSLENELADLRNGGNVSAKRIALQEVIAEIGKTRNEFNEDKRQRVKPLETDLEVIREDIRRINRQMGSLQDEITNKQRSVEAYDRELVVLREKWAAIEAESATVETVCFACEQNLPAEKIETAKKKFLQDKAGRLERIDAEGKETKARMNEYTARIAEATSEIEALRAEQQTAEAKEEAIKPKITAIKAEQPDLSALEEKKAAIEAEIEAAAPPIERTLEINRGVAEIIEQIKALRADLQKVENNKDAQKRIEELTTQEKALAKQFEEIEGNLFLIENFIRAKVELLEGRINDRFSLVRFKLFADQINGGLTEVCETTLNGVPYPSINSAGKIQAGMDIIKTLQGHYGITAPIWIDNRESVIELPAMDCQTIGLIVSEKDSVLRVESNETQEFKKAGGM